MKKLLLLFVAFMTLQNFAQTNTTLSAGLDGLTLNKGTIDVELLTQIIVEKQKEIKDEVLKRFLLRLFPDDNYTTKYYIQNCLNILLKEKNPLVIEKEILELTTNYALAMGVTYSLVNSNDEMISSINADYLDLVYFKEKNIQDIDFNKYITLKKKIRSTSLSKSISPADLQLLYLRRNLLQKEFEALEKSEINDDEKSLFFSDYKKLKEKKERSKRKRNKVKRIKQRRGISANDNDYNSFRDNIFVVYNLIQKLKDRNLKTKLTRKLKKLKFRSLNKKIDDFLGKKKYTDYYTDLKKIKNKLKTFNKTNTIGEVVLKINTQLDSIRFLAKNIILCNIEELTLLDIGKSKNAQLDNHKKLNALYNSNVLDVKSINEIKKFEKVIDILLENHYDNNFNDIKIKFGLLLDVVSLALSEIEELQLKGFYKNKIDYTKSNYYININNLDFKISLNNLKDSVKNKVTPYIKHYDVIKEFLAKNKGENVGEMINILKQEAIEHLGQNLINNGDLVRVFLNKIDKHKIAEKFLSYIELLEIIKNNELTKFNKNADIEYVVKNYFRYNESIEIIKRLKWDLIDIEKPNDLISFPKIIFNGTIKTINTSIPNTELDLLNQRIVAFNENNSNELDFEAISKLIIILKDKNFIKKNIKNVISTEDKLENYYEKINNFINSIENNKVTYLKNINKKIDSITKIISNEDDFYSSYLNNILNIIKKGKLSFKTKYDTLTISKSSKLIANIYKEVKVLSERKSIQLNDIISFEENFTEKIIELKVRDSINHKFYDNLITKSNVILPLLKIKVYGKIVKEKIENNPELLTLFEFISNINKLDKAKTFESIVDMLRVGSEKVEKNLANDKFKNSYLLFINAIKKYTVINSKKNYVEIDVASFLNDLKNYYDANATSRLAPYLTLGLSQNFFLKKEFLFDKELMPLDTLENSIKNIGFASEKIGIKYSLFKFKNYNSYKNSIDDIYLNKKDPIVNDVYAVLYGSGLLYSIANTSTDAKFNYPYLGLGFGVRFFNALDANVSIGLPFIKDRNFLDDPFLSFSFDIPLGEYLERLGRNK